MTSDINIIQATVTAIQGSAVSTTTPTDGYVLTWDESGDGYWEPKPIPSSGGLRKEYFTSSDTWTCPEGVTNILVIAAGGGGGGRGGNPNDMGSEVGGGGAGSGSIQHTATFTVIPFTNYSIIIGAGGSGGVGGVAFTSSGEYGGDGGFTSFGTLFKVAGGRGATNIGGINVIPYGNGGNASTTGNFNENIIHLPGEPGTYLNFGWSGGGGGAGPQGNGANGGDDGGGNGYSAAVNTGAGGGGGGGHSAFSLADGGDGGNGGSGYLYIIY